MSDHLKQLLMQMCAAFMRPIVRILLRAGMTYAEFERIAKLTFVDVASGEFGKRGRPANVSRVAIITGLSRRAVQQQRAVINSGAWASPGDGEKPFWSPATRVLTAWHRDPEFAEADGTPRPLPRRGEQGSFEALLKRYAGDIPHGAMTSELERVGAIAADGDRVRAVSRSYVSSDQNDEVLNMVGTFLHDFASTVDFNLQLGASEKPWFQRIAYTTELKPSALKVLRRLVSRDGQALLEKIDAWMTDHEVADEAEAPVRAGVGVYFFQDRARTRSYKMTLSESLAAHGDIDVPSFGAVQTPSESLLGEAS